MSEQRNRIARQIAETAVLLQNSELSYKRRHDLQVHYNRLIKQFKQQERWEKYGNGKTNASRAGE